MNKFDNYLDFLEFGEVDEAVAKSIIAEYVKSEGITYADDSLEFQRGLLIGMRTGCKMMQIAARNIEGKK
jgi:hypothetical protein